MPSQLSLEGFEAPIAANDRLFFALMPDAATASHIAGIAKRFRAEHGLTGRSIATERLHVTLCWLGDFAGLPAGLVERAGAAATTINAAPVEVVFDRVTSFHRPHGSRPVVLVGSTGVPAVAAFQQVLRHALQRAGLAVQTRPYLPHLTLQYSPRGIREQAIEPVAWTANGFVLVRSLIGKTKHVTLGRWPLRAPEAI